MAFSYVKCVIVDKVSMLSSDNLNAVDYALRQITKRLDDPFGVLDVIMCGDLRHVPPVRANEIYKRCLEVSSGLFGSTIKWHYLDYFPLVQVIRQADTSFSALLTNIGDGRQLAEEEVRLLESMFVTSEEALLRPPSAIRIFNSNDEVNKFNTFVATQQVGGEEDVRLRAQDTFLGCMTQDALQKERDNVERMSHMEYANLPQEILIVPNKPYMITTNIDVIDELVNGAVGTLKLCERAVDDAELPKCLWLRFDDVATTGKLARSPSLGTNGEQDQTDRPRYRRYVDPHQTSRYHANLGSQDGCCMQAKAVSIGSSPVR